MPGGLTRVSVEPSSLVVSMQLGGGSKDTWVLDGGRSAGAPPTAREAPLLAATSRRTAGIPSRVADNLFWLGRYAERVEAGVRLVRALLPVLSGESDLGRTASLDTAIHLLTALNYLPLQFIDIPLAERRWQLHGLLSRLIFDPMQASGIGWNLRNLRRATWPLKERLSQDTWQVLQQLDADFGNVAPGNPETRLAAQTNLLDRAIITLSAFAGLLNESTTRGPGWRFLELGRRLERSLQTVTLLRAALSQAPFEGERVLEALLQILDSSITYHTRYFTALRTEYVLELLFADEGNPRSLAFQLALLATHTRHLPGYDPDPERFAPARLANQALQTVRGTNLRDLAETDEEGNLAAFEALARGLSGTLFELSDALATRYFHHLTATRLA